MLKNYQIKTLLVVCLMAIFGGMSAWGATNTYTHTFESNPFTVDANKRIVSNTPQTQTMSGLSWTLVGQGSAVTGGGYKDIYLVYETANGLHIGSGSYPMLSGSLSTSDITGKVKSVSLNGKGANCSVSVAVGESPLGSSSKMTSSYADYSFSSSEGIDASSSSPITISFSNTSSAFYIKSITITYETVDTGKEAAGITYGSAVGQTPIYVTTLAKGFTAPTLTNPNALAISYISSNEAVATVASDGTVELKGNGTATITAHTDGDATHDAGDAKYTLKVLEGITGLDGLYADGVITSTDKEYLLTLTDVVVTYNNGKYTYLQDANRGMLIFSDTDKPAVGKKINGDVIVKTHLYNNLYQLTEFDYSAATLTDASAEELQPAVATIAQILAAPKSYESKYIKIVDATVKSAFSSRNSVIYQDDAETNTITMRDGNSSGPLTSKVGDIVTVTGFPTVFGTTQQITVWSQDDIVSAIKYFEYSATSCEAKIGVSNTFPALTNDYEETPIFSSSNEAVATIDAAGVVTLVAAGTTTITATLATAGKSASYVLTVSELQSYAYTRVNDASEIVDGGKYILVAEPMTISDVETVLALTAPSDDNKYFASQTLTSDVYYYGYADVAGSPYELTLESTGTDGQYFVKCNGVYLQGSSANANFTFLDAKPETTNTNAIWTVMINGEKGDLKCVGADKVFGLNKNTTDKRFALYATTFSSLGVSHLYRRYNKTGEGSVAIATTEGYGTLYSDKAVVMPEGLTATTVKAAADGQLTMDWEYAAGNTVPAGTGLLVKGENGTTYDFITTDNAVTLTTANLLSGSVADALTTGAAGSKFYKLTYSEVAGEQVLGFFWGAAKGAAFTNDAGKAYLVIPAGSEANGFRLDGSAITGINNVELDSAADKIYTISGVAVSAKKGNLPAGLYIVNGKKQIVK